MPSRLKRYQTEDHYHFITFSCFHRLPYLNSDHARITFEEVLERVRQRHQFFLFGYVIMPEHVHLLLTEPKLQRLSTTMSSLKGATSKLLKGNREQFWQVRYFDFNVLTDKKRIEKLRYVHRNPVERGLVEKPVVDQFEMQTQIPFGNDNQKATAETKLTQYRKARGLAVEQFQALADGRTGPRRD